MPTQEYIKYHRTDPREELTNAINKAELAKKSDMKPIISKTLPIPDDLNVDDSDDDEEEDDGKCVIPHEKDIEFCETNWFGKYKTEDKCKQHKQQLIEKCEKESEQRRNITRYTTKQQLMTQNVGGKRKKKTKSKRRRTKRRRTKKRLNMRQTR
jgi:hypothetical protein